MVVVETPDGTQSRFRLTPSRGGWRLVHRHASYDLVTMIQSGWRVLAAESDTDRRRIRRVFRLHAHEGPRPHPSERLMDAAL